MPTPFRGKKSEIGKTGTYAEKKAVSRLQARPMPNSGAMEGAKGDFEVGEFLVENKSTIHDSISIKRDWIGKITSEAQQSNKIPAIAIQFVDGTGRPKPCGKHVLIPEWLFKELTTK